MSVGRPITVIELLQLGMAWVISGPAFYVGHFVGEIWFAYSRDMFPSSVYGGIVAFFVFGGIVAIFVSSVECKLWAKMSRGFFSVVDAYKIGPISVWFAAGCVVVWF